jgi:hypothetical protein
MIAFASEDATVLLISLVVHVVLGIVTASIAANRGRSGVGWFFIGIIAGCVGVILALVLPDLRQQEAQMRRQELENRRLREQLAKERQVADNRHGHVERRLGVHDQALGVDTAPAAALPGGAGAPPPLPSPSTWFYARGQERLGPVPAETIRQLLQARVIAADTLVWREGMADWQPLSHTDDFRGDVA